MTLTISPLIVYEMSSYERKCDKSHYQRSACNKSAFDDVACKHLLLSTSAFGECCNDVAFPFCSMLESKYFVFTVIYKGKQKSLGRATSRSRSQPVTPGGREKVTQINVCIANKQMHDKHKTSSLLPSQGDQNAKRTKETHKQRAGQDQTWSASLCKLQSYTE